jgi:uncharacterized protein
MILEGIVTTISPTGDVNIAPMGPRVDADMQRFLLRPFKTAQTYRNLRSHGEGVLHVTDDVLLLARAALGKLDVTPPLLPARKVRGWILADACRAYEFRVLTIDDREDRVSIDVEVVHHESMRDFFGFNRAKHAVVEAAILATRTSFLPLEEIDAEYRKLAVIVQKTGGEQERLAFEFLREYVAKAAFPPSPPGRGAGGEGEKPVGQVHHLPPLDPGANQSGGDSERLGGSVEHGRTSMTIYHSPLPANLLEFTRRLRKEQTDAEKLLWSVLRGRRMGGWKFRRQFPLGPYVLDFFCFEKKLAVELDGGQHNEPSKKRSDEIRTQFVSSKGIRVIRFWNHEMLEDTEVVLQVIWDALHIEAPQKYLEASCPTPSPPAPLPGGEGGKA